MKDSEADRLVELSTAGFCPDCGKTIEEGKAVVRGKGRFCDLECVASHHAAEFIERAKRLAIAARN